MPLGKAFEFYSHDQDWTNRLIAGDSLLVMNSLLKKEGMAGEVQMVYIDPPYGIKYNSNFQPFVNKREVKDNNDDDIPAEPETIKAFRDTWELGMHSYLTYLLEDAEILSVLLHATEKTQKSFLASVLESDFLSDSNNYVGPVKRTLKNTFDRANQRLVAA